MYINFFRKYKWKIRILKDIGLNFVNKEVNKIRNA